MWMFVLACSLTETSTPEPAGHAEPAHADHKPGHGDHATMEHRFEDAKKWASVFDDPARDAWQKPSEVVAAMHIREGQRVADLGAGTGYLVPHLLSAVGPAGTVLALDVETTLVSHMTQRFAEEPRVKPRVTAPDRATLQQAEVDHVVLLDVYHHIDGRVSYFRDLRRALRPGGSLTVVDFDPEAPGEHGPPTDHRIAASQVADELGRAGWVALPAVEADLAEQYIARFRVSRGNGDVAWLADALKGGDVQLLDVRTPREFAAGHIPGARNVPLAEVGSAAESLDASRPVALVCQSGGRSARAADQLSKAGFAAINVVGGTGAWARAGHPVER